MRRLILTGGMLLMAVTLHAQTATMVSIVAAPSAPKFGEPVTLTATLLPANATGTVSFMDGGVLVGVGTVNGSGVAQLTTLTLPAGPRSLRAIYSGASGFQASQSSIVPYVVTATPSAGFGTPATINSGRRAIVVADFNRDGRADFASPDFSGTVLVYTGNGNGTFTLSNSLSANTSTVAVGDFNGDGILDLITQGSSGTVSLFRGNGDGTFQTAVNQAAGVFSITDLAVGDFNTDGKADIAVSGSSFVTVLLGNGNGTFAAPQSFSSGTAQAISISDVNLDGWPDIVFADSSSGFGVVMGIGNGAFRVNYILSGIFPTLVTTSDFNGDGKPDIAGGGPGIWVGMGDGAGQFTSFSQYLVGLGVNSVVAADVTGDGKTDLVASDSSSRLWVLAGRGDGTFQQGISYASGSGSGASRIGSGDFNGDGGADLIVISPNSTNLANLFLARTPPVTGTVLQSTLPSNYGEPLTLIADVMPAGTSGHVEFLDGSSVIGVSTLTLGRAQLTTNALAPGLHSLRAVYEGVSGTWDPSQSSTVSHTVNSRPGGSFQLKGSFSTANGPVRGDTGDFDKDGKTDIVTANSSANNVSVLLGNGDGTLKPAVNFSAGTNPSAVAVSDFNGDGNSDLAVANLGSNTVSVLTGLGTGSFNSAVPFSVGSSPVSLTVSDFNLDGRADIAVANFGSNTVSVLLGNGSAGFATALNFPVGSGPRAVIAVDLNGDGRPDLATANATDNSVSVLLGNGNGTFAAATSNSVGVSPVGLIAGRFRTTSIIDLAIVNSVSSTVSVLQNNGNGTFPPPTSYSTVSDPTSITAADFNADGKIDLAVASATAGMTSVLRGTGSATFQAATNFISAGTAVLSANLDGDRIVDLALFNNSGNAVNSMLGAAQLPVPVSILPAGGTGSNAVFTFTFADGDGADDLEVVNILINNLLNGLNACWIGYNRTVNRITIVNDAGTSTSSTGSFGPVTNSQCTATGIASAVQTSGNTLTLTLNITFSNAFAGAKVVYLAARDFEGNNSGWQAMGTWRVPQPGQPTSGPAVGGVSPSNGSGLSQTFDFTFTDTNGWQDLGIVNVLINSFLDARSACYIAYNRVTGLLYLADDTGTAPVTNPGGSTVFNSQCLVDPTGLSVQGNGNTLTLRMTLTFFSTFQGNRTIYMAASDISNVRNSLWQAAGTWRVAGGGAPVPAVAVSPARGTSSHQSVTFTFTDPAGWQNIGFVYILIKDVLDARNACYLSYNRVQNRLSLVNDAGTFASNIVLSGSGSLSNSQCRVDGAASSVVPVNTTLTLNLDMEFFLPLAGNNVVYLASVDIVNNNTGWQPSGTWSVPGVFTPALTVGSAIPVRMSSANQAVTFSFSDVNGWQDIESVSVIVNDYLNGIQACYVTYDRVQNRLYIRNDAGPVSLGPITPGSGSLANSQCTLNGAGSIAAGNGATLTLTLDLTFSHSFAGNRIIYGSARNIGGVLNSGWQSIGTWSIP